MVDLNLIRNLEKNNLQPFIWKVGAKKVYWNNKYFEFQREYQKEHGLKITFTNSPFILDYKDITGWTKPDARVGIALKIGTHRDLNRGVFCMDFDLKGSDDMSVFDDIVESLKAKGYWRQVEKKRNGKGYHLFLRMTPEDMDEVVALGKIHRGEESFVEILTAGKFIRLCPNDDYIIDDTEGKSIDFGKLDIIPLEILKGFSTDEKDRLLQNKRSYRQQKEILKKNITFSVDPNIKLKTEEEKLLYAYIKSHLDYNSATSLAAGLGYAKYKDVFYATIPPEVLPKFENLFLNGYYEPYRLTVFMKELLGTLRTKKRESEIIRINYETEYLPDYAFDDLRKQGEQLIFNSPTGTGKTTALLHYCKFFCGKKFHEFLTRNIIVVPTKAIANQIGEKEPGFSVINSDNSTKNNGVLKRVIKALAFENPNIVITHKTFRDNIELFLDLENTTFFIDEAHKIVCNNANEISIIQHTREGRFQKIVFLSATTLKLEKLMPNMKTVYATTTKKYDITLDIFDGIVSMEAVKELVQKLLKAHRKILVHYQDKTKGALLKEHFEGNHKTFLYNGDVKDIKIEDERISKDWDLIICTGSLTEGVSLRDDYYSLFIATSYDNYDSITQFINRNRNSKSFGGIMLKLRDFDYCTVWETFQNTGNYELNESFTSIEARLSQNYNRQLLFTSLERLRDNLNPDFKYNPVVQLDDPEEEEARATEKVLSLDEKLKLWAEGKAVRDFVRTKYGRVIKLITDYFNKNIDDKLKLKNIEYIIKQHGIQPKGTRTTRDYRQYLAYDVIVPYCDTIETLMKSERRDFILQNVVDKLDVDFSPIVGIEYKKKSDIKKKVISALAKQKITEYSSKSWEEILNNKGYAVRQFSKKIEKVSTKFYKVEGGKK